MPIATTATGSWRSSATPPCTLPRAPGATTTPGAYGNAYVLLVVILVVLPFRCGYHRLGPDPLFLYVRPSWSALLFTLPPVCLDSPRLEDDSAEAKFKPAR